MQKPFIDWSNRKISIENKFECKFFIKEGDMWWCSLGVNIGSEQDGTGSCYDRPVLILKKFNERMCIALPITSKAKSGPHHYTLRTDSNHTVILSQIRLISTKRLFRRLGTIQAHELLQIKSLISNMILS